MRKLIVLIVLSLVVSIGLENVADTSLIKTSARALGMGRAFAPLADDYTSLFMNPAGLAKIKNLQLGLMQDTLMDTVFNINGVVVLPLKDMTFAIGGIYSGANGIYLTGRDVLTNRVFASGGNADYSNTMLVVGAASHVGSAFFSEDNLLLGLSGKLYFENVGGNLSYSGFGFNSDLGALYTVSPVLDLSLTYHNFLPTGVKWSTNHNANLDYTMSTGLKYTLMSENLGSIFTLGKQTLDLVADVEMINQYNKISPKLGLEYKPYEFLALRAGYSNEAQALSSSSVQMVNKYSMGVGVYYSGLRFDYAYVIDPDGFDANNTHYFSMLLDIFPASTPKVIEAKEVDYVFMDSPADKFITYYATHDVAGTVIPGVEKVKVNDVIVPVNNGRFSTNVVFKDLGKHVIRVSAYDGADNLLGYKDTRVLYLVSFPDVKDKNWARRYIEDLATCKLLRGFPDGFYRPNSRIKRGEFSALLVRTKKIPHEAEGVRSTDDEVFTDLKNNWVYPYAIAAYNAGLIFGYPNKKFMPEKPTLREETVISMVKMDDLILPPQGVKSRFSDVIDGSDLSRYVEVSYQNGIIIGYPDGTFKPINDISRAEMARIFYNSKLGQIYVKDLYDWPSYKYNTEDFK